MSWLLAIALACAAFAFAAFLLKVAPRAWTTLAAALTLGLAGYALQARPDLPGAPAAPPAEADLPGEALKTGRQEFIASGDRSRNPRLLTADAFAARGRYSDAAALMAGALEQNPQDAEAWLALGNVLVEHAGGTLTEPALFAYERARETDPASAGPGYFLGLALLRQGSVLEGRNLWAQTLATIPDDAEGRELLAERLAGLDVLLQRAAAAPQMDRGAGIRQGEP